MLIKLLMPRWHCGRGAFDVFPPPPNNIMDRPGGISLLLLLVLFVVLSSEENISKSYEELGNLVGLKFGASGTVAAKKDGTSLIFVKFTFRGSESGVYYYNTCQKTRIIAGGKKLLFQLSSTTTTTSLKPDQSPSLPPPPPPPPLAVPQGCPLRWHRGLSDFGGGRGGLRGDEQELPPRRL